MSQSPRLHLWVYAGASAFFFASQSLLVWLSEVRYWKLDLAVSRALQSIENQALTLVMRIVSWPGDEVLWATGLVALAAGVLLFFGRWREAIVLVCIVLVAQALKIGLKNLIGRPRPQPDVVNILIQAHEINSFPSGHTVHYTVTFGFLWYLTYQLVKPPLARWPLMVLCATMVFLVGPARIYLGAHWITDIIGGHFLGLAVLTAGIGIYEKWRGDRR